MAPYLGDFPADQAVNFMWDTNDSDGASITRSGDGVISVYKDNSDGSSFDQTQVTTGVTNDEDVDGLTGVHSCCIVTTDGWYETGHDYVVVLSASTIDTQTVNAVLATFSIENRFMRGTDSGATATALATVDTEVGQIKAVTDNLPDSGALTTIGTDAARLTAVRAAVLTDWIDAGRLDALLDAIKAVTDNLPESGALTTIAADTARLTAARAGVLDDWINDGRLDAILDIIAADVVNIDGSAMVGTNSAALASVCTEARLSELDAATAGKAANQIDEIRTDTEDLQTQVGTAGAGLTDLGGMSTGMKAEVEAECDDSLATYDAPTKAEMDTAHALLATPANVNTEVSDVMKTDVISEMAQGIPPTTPTFEEAVMYLYMALTKAIDVDATLKEFYNNAGDVIWKKTIADDASNYTEAKGASGP